MSNNLTKSILVGAGVIGAVAGTIVAKKAYDKQNELSDEKKALLQPKPGQRLGHFVCLCGKEWESPFAWVGERQQCVSCDAWVDPKVLSKLDGKVVQRLKRKDVHDESRCSRCVKYQKRCYEL
eukprot:Gregarina_sp_Pseudo_9__2313@NODE_262_length_3360_cov_153_092743_g245_i0_p4_GENE_NODE_262_length_3360_cov_153_092743_g245_i0NODE_262_length_3360_cov_153_092743_g245_i0_p4_ORF_typecomplete_len137_score25_82zf3CxxC_2/PF17180_4/4_9e11UPF0515/PF15135_6/0_0073DiS_P_DiS/PF06750_13/69_NODE_262_length_3360_cov_153_092743_g245_i044412